MTWFSGARLVQGACCDLVRRRRGSAQPKVHEERFARRNTFRREFGLLLRCVARRSQIAGAEILSYQEAPWALTLSFRARMQELRRLSFSKTGGLGLIRSEADSSLRPPTRPRTTARRR